MLNIAVLISGNGTNLQALIDKKDVYLPGKITLTVSNNKDAYGLVRAKENGIRTAVIDDKVNFENILVKTLEENEIDIIVLAGFLKILSEEFVSKYKKRIINVHPSLLPSFGGTGFYGLKVHEAALKRGVKISGATVHFVNEIPDGGEIIMQKAVSVHEDDTPETLQKRIMQEAEWQILPLALAEVCRMWDNKRKEK